MATRRVRTSTQVSLANFADRMDVLAQRVVRRSNEGVKEVAAETVKNLINDTPKDTGQAAANWQVGINEMPSFKPGYTDISGARASALAEIEKRKAGETVFISNPTPYIGLLNAGHSSQAPAMFVERAIARANRKIRQLRLLK